MPTLPVLDATYSVGVVLVPTYMPPQISKVSRGVVVATPKAETVVVEYILVPEIIQPLNGSDSVKEVRKSELQTKPLAVVKRQPLLLVKVPSFMLRVSPIRLMRVPLVARLVLEEISTAPVKVPVYVRLPSR